MILPPSVGPGYDIIIYPGQSNTVGGGQGPWTDPTDHSFDGSIFQVGRDAEDMMIVPMTDPLPFPHPTYLHAYGTSLARYYAANILDRANGRNILIIPAAHGSTSVLDWLGDIAYYFPLYSDMSARISLGLSQTSGINRIVGWFECQGETDVVSATTITDPNHSLMKDASYYYNAKCRFINQVRTDFGVFPMFFGLFSQGWLPGDPTKTAFESTLKLIASTQPFCQTISTIEVQDDSQAVGGTLGSVHYSAEGQEQLALRFYNAYVDMIN